MVCIGASVAYLVDSIINDQKKMICDALKGVQSKDICMECLVSLEEVVIRYCGYSIGAEEEIKCKALSVRSMNEALKVV